LSLARLPQPVVDDDGQASDAAVRSERLRAAADGGISGGSEQRGRRAIAASATPRDVFDFTASC
jgi:hypothetical protein